MEPHEPGYYASVITHPPLPVSYFDYVGEPISGTSVAVGANHEALTEAYVPQSISGNTIQTPNIYQDWLGNEICGDSGNVLNFVPGNSNHSFEVSYPNISEREIRLDEALAFVLISLKQIRATLDDKEACKMIEAEIDNITELVANGS